MSDNPGEYMTHAQPYEFAHCGAGNQSALENAFRAVNDSETLHREISERNSAGGYHYYSAPEDSTYQGQNGSSANNHNNQFAHEHSRQYEGNPHQFQQVGGRMDGRNETYNNHPASGPMGHNGPHEGHLSNHPNSQLGQHNPQFQSNVLQSAAAVPIPAMALHVSNLSSNFGPGSMSSHLPGTVTGVSAIVGDPSAPPKSRCIEEDFAIILQRSASAAAKSSNTKYRCLFCNFTFVGGPQKIRVHLTGKRENGTRLSRCENCPEEVRRKLEERMKAPKEAVNEAGLYDDDVVNDVVSLPPRNVEEQHVVVLSRSQSSNSKSSNTRYKCRYCRFKFVGGPQKIRVHLTGQQEGGTRMSKCTRVPDEVIIQMEHRRKAPKPDLLATPTGSSSSSATAGAGAGGASGEGAGTSATAQQQAYIIAQQQQALIKQQQQHAAQLQLQQQQLQQLQRQQQLQQQLHAQQQLQQQQHIQQLIHQQHVHLATQQQQQQQQHIQHPLHGGMHPAAAQLHGGQLPLHLHPQHMLHLGQQTTAQLLMQQQQQQMRQHPHLAHHQQIPPHLLFPHGPGSPSTSSAQHAHLLQQQAQHQQAQQQSHLLHSAHAGLHPAAHLMHPAAQAHLGYDLHDEATAAVYHAELQHLQAAAAQAAAQAQQTVTTSGSASAAQATPVSPSRSPTPVGSEEPSGAASGPSETPETAQAATAASSSGDGPSAAAASLDGN